jgi:WD40 repeat protein
MGIRGHDAQHVDLFDGMDGKGKQRIPNRVGLKWSPSGEIIWKVERKDKPLKAVKPVEPVDPAIPPLQGQGPVAAPRDTRVVSFMNAEGKIIGLIKMEMPNNENYERVGLVDRRDGDVHVAFTRDEKIIATNTDPALWEVSSGKLLRTCKPALGYGTEIRWMAFSKNDEKLAVLTETAQHHGIKNRQPRPECMLILYDVKSGEEQRRIKLSDEDFIGSVVTSPDRTLVAYGTSSKMGVIDMASGNEVLSMRVGQRVSCIAFSQGGKYLAFGCGHTQDAKKGEFTLVNLSDPRISGRVTGLDDNITAIAFPDNTTLAAGDSGGKITIWNIR